MATIIFVMTMPISIKSKRYVQSCNKCSIEALHLIVHVLHNSRINRNREAGNYYIKICSKNNLGYYIQCRLVRQRRPNRPWFAAIPWNGGIQPFFWMACEVARPWGKILIERHCNYIIEKYLAQKKPPRRNAPGDCPIIEISDFPMIVDVLAQWASLPFGAELAIVKRIAYNVLIKVFHHG